ncbi:hypothetical protein O181_113896 [Austropuccinia psidii MF-1]|uniref:Uncharacterized protein n=1 Tax=Austropuccinia psidii MF-1 TaxID=1389203 RepID=A0A9Q3K5V1_9BASI|nr:hypothetical protein [Austropuccinia psidii MF-1]
MRNNFNFFTIQLITPLSICIRWGISNPLIFITFTTPSVLVLEIGTSELEYMGLPPIGMGPPTLVHLATSLCLEPVTTSNYQYQNQTRYANHSHSEKPEVPSGVGASETGSSFPNAHPSYSTNTS